MASELSLLIAHLKKYKPVGDIDRPPALNFIIDYPRFIKTLENMNKMVGLKVIKAQIAHQIQGFIANYRRHGKPTDGEKLHTLLYGPPGCGKTQIGEYLAEIWACSGCLPEPKTTEPKPPGLSFNVDTDNEKVLLKQNLSIQTAQLQQYQQKVETIAANTNNLLTQFNNVRKKVKSRTPDREPQIQAKFQEIKNSLKEIGSHANNSKPSTGILPVTVPKIPGTRSTFGNYQPPLLPHIPLTITEPSKRIVKFLRVTRGDLIGKFQGHSTDKVRKLLEEYTGGVIMIDEAYSLCTSSHDDFGKEILTEIINYMTTWPDKVTFIFGGYRKEMEESLLKFQPGLARRFGWTFEIVGYTHDELSLIFQQQLENKLKSDLVISDEMSSKLSKFFILNASKFPYFGGDTERLSDIVKETFNKRYWLNALDNTITDEEYKRLFTNIDFECIKISFDKYLENSVAKKATDSENDSWNRVQHMYS